MANEIHTLQRVSNNITVTGTSFRVCTNSNGSFFTGIANPGLIGYKTILVNHDNLPELAGAGLVHIDLCMVTNLQVQYA